MNKLLVLALGLLTANAMAQSSAEIERKTFELRNFQIAEHYTSEAGKSHHFQDAADIVCRESFGFDYALNFTTIRSQVLNNPAASFMQNHERPQYFDRTYNELRTADKDLEYWAPNIVDALTCIKVADKGSLILERKRPRYKEYKDLFFSHKSNKDAVCKYLGFDISLKAVIVKHHSKAERIQLDESGREEIVDSKKWIASITCKR